MRFRFRVRVRVRVAIWVAVGVSVRVRAHARAHATVHARVPARAMPPIQVRPMPPVRVRPVPLIRVRAMPPMLQGRLHTVASCHSGPLKHPIQTTHAVVWRPPEGRLADSGLESHRLESPPQWSSLGLPLIAVPLD